jgi:TM2 domain-containing membrane protein YozV
MEKEIIHANASSKSRLAALLLAFFLGSFGLHRMYVGRFGSGVVQLILTITIIGALITIVWVIFDILFILLGTFKDKSGKPLKTW